MPVMRANAAETVVVLSTEEAAEGQEPTCGFAADAGSLFRAHGRQVARTALRILGRRDEADDVVQDVFLAAHRGIRRLRREGAAAAWLMTVTVRICRKRLRHRRLWQLLSLDDCPDYLALADARATAEQRVLLATIYRVLDSLPVRMRLAWALRHLEERPLDEVALLCGCSLATAKRDLQSAHAAILAEVSHG